MISRKYSNVAMIVLIFLVEAAAARGQSAEVAVCGDSISTGAATHPNMEFDGGNLWSILRGEIAVSPKAMHLKGVEAAFPQIMNSISGVDDAAVLPPPQRPWPTIREYRTSVEWVALGLLRTISETYLDTEEFSWGYQLGRAQNINPANILIAAENGARSVSASSQIARILEINSGVLPKKVYLLFTGNDICAHSVESITTAEQYGENLFNAMRLALRQSNLAEGGSDVIVPAFVNVTQLLTIESIQTKLVRAFGTRIACGKLRENQFVSVLPANSKNSQPPEAAMLSHLLPPNPAAMCPTLFARAGKGGDQSELIGALANRIREFRTAAKNAVAKATSLQKEKFKEKSIRFHFIEETANFALGGDDVAEDCFHLSILGQAKLARTIFDAEKTLAIGSGGSL